MTRVLAGFLALFAVTASGASASDAAFPGRNGLLAFASNRSPLVHGEVFAVDIRTGRRSNVSRNWEPESEPLRSPKGRALALVGEDGIYVMDLATRKRRRVVRIRGSRPLVHRLAWSPDGRRIAYVPAAGDAVPSRVFVVSARGGKPTGAGRCDPEGPCFAWAPDGRRLAVIRNAGDLYVVRIGSRDRRLIARNARYPAWSPDGRWIAYSSRSLMVVSPSGGARRRLWPRGGPTAWSPDSAAVAVNAGNVVYRVSVRRGGSRRLGFVSGEGSGLLWSPSGRWIAPTSSGRLPNHILELLSTTGRGHRRFRVSRGDTDARSPSWSPDGTKLFYGAQLDGFAAPYRVHVVRADGTHLRRVGAGSQPRWSPDGMQIAYDCDPGLCVMAGDGSARKRVATGRIGGGISWSPDGAELAFVRGGNVHVVAADGSGLRQVSQTPGSDDDYAFAPAWSPDGRWIAYTRHRHYSNPRFNPCCTETLMLIAAAGGEPRVLKVNDLVAYYPSPAWSPDGKRIAFVDQEGDEFCNEGPDGTECPPSHLFVLSLDGSRITPVGPLDRRLQFDPAWSPDGKLIAYDDGYDIAIVGANGTGRRNVLGRAARGGEDVSPDWQPRCTRYGDRRRNRLDGTTRSDVVCGLGGSDTIAGGAGSDRLFGEDGDDQVLAQDGEFDVVGCGPGRDTVAADLLDLVGRDCELVVRR